MAAKDGLVWLDGQEILLAKMQPDKYYEALRFMGAAHDLEQSFTLTAIATPGEGYKFTISLYGRALEAENHG